MDERTTAGIVAWVTEAGLAGASEPDLLQGFCERGGRGGAAGACRRGHRHAAPDPRGPRLSLASRPRRTSRTVVEYGRDQRRADIAENWRRSPFYHLLETGGRRCCAAASPRGDRRTSRRFEEMRARGSDRLRRADAPLRRATGVIGEMDCVYSSWATDAPDGFARRARRRRCAGWSRCWRWRSSAPRSARIAGTLVETYLGRDAGRRVLSGRIARGVADRISAVLWFSDLRGYTTHHRHARAPEQIIPLLNDYAEAVISADPRRRRRRAEADRRRHARDLHGRRSARTPAAARSRAEALTARRGIDDAQRAPQRGRAADHRRSISACISARCSTAISAATTGSTSRSSARPSTRSSRIAAMCRSVERDVLLSSAFAAAVDAGASARLVSVGRYALRGVGRPQELFTLEPDAEDHP